jgi:flavorubredoxin/NADPH-dependent 2,4-dienoyl-CoA reductase/sulfur reductase-like enzyme/rubredoxin
MKVGNNIFWIGEKDPNLRVFDIIMQTEFGTTYNSYLIKGSEKNALVETVKEKFFDEYIERISEIIDIEDIDYLIVNHTEPDHAGSIGKLIQKYPNIEIIASETAINFLKEITNIEFKHRAVDTGDMLNLGNKTIKFYSVPFLHWPDSMYSYLIEDRTLFTCDSFGSHYSFEGVLHSDVKKHDDYFSALNYYYQAIFGPFKAYVLSAIDKISELNIEMICPGHGPVLDDNPMEIVDTYKKWSQLPVKNEKKIVSIPYVSAYGFTGEIAERIAQVLDKDYSIKSELFDLVTSEISEIMASINKADGLLVGTPTINGDALKPIWDLVTSLSPIVHNDKIASSFGSYGWSGEGVPNIITRLDQLRMKVLDGLAINFRASEDDYLKVDEFAKSFGESLVSGKVPPRKNKPVSDWVDLNPSGKVKKWKCTICGEIYEGVYPPEICPACGVTQDLFVEVVDEEISFKSKDRKNIVVVGAGAAGVSAVQEIRKRNEACSIILISEEDSLPYYRPRLTKDFDENNLDGNFYLINKKWIKENKIDFRSSTKVTEILAKDRKVKLSSGDTVKYDELILATGAKPFLPPIRNIELAGVFSQRSIEDIKLIKQAGMKSKKAVIIGGGVLGLEAAHELKQLGVDVSVVEISQRILPRMIDEKGSNLLTSMFEEEKINILTNKKVKSILGEKSVTGVELTTGEVIDADLVVVSAGIEPEIGFIKQADIKVNKGIVVDNKMQTNIPNIYAAGDISEFEGCNYGLWQPALEQGKVAGINAVGDELIFEPEVYPTSFQTEKIDAFSVGLIDTTNTKVTAVQEFIDDKSKTYTKLIFAGNVLIGGILINNIDKASAILKYINHEVSIGDFLGNFYK